MEEQMVDPAKLSVLELLASFIVENGGGKFVGLQKPYVPGQQTLVLFNASNGATLVLPLDELSTEAVRKKLKKCHEDFGIPWHEKAA